VPVESLMQALQELEDGLLEGAESGGQACGCGLGSLSCLQLVYQYHSHPGLQDSGDMNSEVETASSHYLTPLGHCSQYSCYS
jgi:hypothetical protein